MYATISDSLPTEVIIADALAKRDTTAITTPWIPIDGLKSKRLWYNNGLDQALNVVIRVSKDGGTTSFQAGAPKSITASSGFGIATEADATLLGMNMIKGHIQFVITPAVAPTVGALTMAFNGLPI